MVPFDSAHRFTPTSPLIYRLSLRLGLCNICRRTDERTNGRTHGADNTQNRTVPLDPPTDVGDQKFANLRIWRETAKAWKRLNDGRGIDRQGPDGCTVRCSRRSVMSRSRNLRSVAVNSARLDFSNQSSTCAELR